MPRYAFGAFELDTDEATLVGPDGAVAVERQVFDVLAHLIDRAGSLVTKNDLLDNVWGDRFVAESSLTSRIYAARKAVGDTGRAQAVIKTVHGRGYRFVPEVRVVDGGAGPGAPTASAPMATTRRLPPSLESQTTERCVGRDAELDRVLRAVGADRHPGAGVVWIVGEPGIGKTRLAAEVADRMAETGTEVLFGRCSEDLAVPYQPCIEALREWLIGRSAPTAEHAASVLGPGARALQRLVPELAESVGPEPAPGGHGDADSERYQLLHAVAQWLQVASAERPLLWVIDDLHWATRPTLQLIDHLRTTPLEMRVAIVATARDTAPDDSDEMRRFRSHSAADQHGCTVHLAGLDENAIAELTADRAGAGEIRVQTMGNPLLIRAVVQQEGGAGTDGDERVDLDHAVQRRLSGLDASSQQLLTLAAVEGLEFDVTILAAASRSAEVDVLDRLDLAADARLVHEIDADRYRFAHALVRDALRNRPSRSRLRRAHLALADAIEERAGADLGSVADRVLRHLDESGDERIDPDRFVRLATAAADRAVGLLDFDAAVTRLDAALERIGSGGSTTVPAAPLLLRRGQIQARAGLSVPGAESFERAFLAAESEDDTTTLVEAAIGLEGVSWRPGLHGGHALQRLDRAATVVRDDESRTRARLAMARGRALMFADDREAAERAFTLAAELVSDLDDPALEADLLSARLLQVTATPRPGLVEDARRLQRLGVELGATDHQLMGLQIRAVEHMRRGEADRTWACVNELRTVAGAEHSLFWSYAVASHDASRALFLGDLAEAERLNDVLEELSAELVGEDNSGTDSFRTFLLTREQDRLRHLAPLIRQVVASAAPGPIWRPGLAILLAEIGDLDGAAAAMDDVDPLGVSELDAMWPAIMAFSAEVVHRLGDADRAAELLGRVRSQSGRLLVVGYDIANLGAADRFIGLLHATVGDLEQADEALRRAEELNRACGSLLWAGYCRLHRAELARSAGDPAAADEHLGRAASIAEERGLPALRRRAEELVAEG